jgi:hypothetical protein
VEDDLRAVLGLDDHVRLGPPALGVAALVAALLPADQLASRDRLVGIEHRREHLPLDLDQLEGRARLAEGVGRDRCDRCARIRRLLRQAAQICRADRRLNAGRLEGPRKVDPLHIGAGVRGAQDGGVQHPRQPHVGGVARLAPGARVAVDPCRGPADDGQRAVRPRVEVVLLDNDPLLGVVALDLLFGADQPRQLSIASSILG